MNFIKFINFIFNLFTIINVNDFCRPNDSLISISPGGLTGFYSLGVSSYIKENYDVSEYSFLGASAGSWNSLLFTCKHSSEEVLNTLLSRDVLFRARTLPELTEGLGNHILTNYQSDDFNLDRLYISVSKLGLLRFKPQIMYNFTNLDEAVNGCLSSSYIPFITSKFRRMPINNIIMDGGINTFPPKQINAYLNIYPSMWGRDFTPGSGFRYPANHDYFIEMYMQGYQDTKKNKKVLDAFFESYR